MNKKRLLINTLLTVSLIITFSTHTSVLASKQDIVSINIFNEKYYGTLSDQGKESIFTSLSDSDPQLTVSGTWKDGSFDGDCTISFEDGTVQSVVYSKKKITGEVTTKYPDEKYSLYSCTSGKRVGCIQYFDNSGELTDIDWFHNCVPIHTLIENTVEINYTDISASPSEYIDMPVKLSGKITSIFDSNNQCYLVLTDSENNNYLLHYRNAEITPNYAAISIMENLSVGDFVIVYGIFENIRTLSNTKKIFNSCYGYQSDFSELKPYLFDSEKLSDMKELFPNEYTIFNDPMPVLDAFFCETENTSNDPLHILETYENICKYPMYFMDRETQLSGTVLYDTFIHKKKTVLRVVECTPNEYYIVSEKSPNYVSMVGETITVHGVWKGNKKLPYLASQEIGYVVFPSIEMSK